MKREERVLKISALAISTETADAIVDELSRLAAEKRNAEFEERLRAAYKSDRAGTPKMDPAAQNEDEFVQRNFANQDFWKLANIPTYQNYIFLAKSGNVSLDDTCCRSAEGHFLPKGESRRTQRAFYRGPVEDRLSKLQ
jgi:hypothetical protein